MKKKNIIILSILVLLLISIIGFILFKNDEDYNKKLELTVHTNAGVPYKWEYEIEDGNIVKFIDSYIINDKKDETIDGAPLDINYVFEGVKTGKTKIILRYVNINDNKVEKKEVFNVKVNNKKGISLVAMD